MEKILIFIKHNFSFLWKMIELFNSVLLYLMYSRKIKSAVSKFDNYYKINENFKVKMLNKNDLDILSSFLGMLDSNNFQYFKPHKMDKESIHTVLKKDSMLKFGFYDRENKLIGYFILRLFFNKKCFIGRLVHPDFRGQGIAQDMAKILYCISKEIDFNVYSTISKKNIASLKSHEKVNKYTIEKELEKDFYLIKFNLEDYKC